MSNILKFAEQYSYKVVVKPLKGTGGICVFKTCSPKEVEAAVYKVWSRDYGVAVSPLLDIVAEIRVIVYNGQHRLVYRKNRIILTGDGQRTVKELLVEAIKTSSDDLVKHYAQALAKLTPNDLADIPQENQQVPIEWRHNLGLGASPEIIDHQAAAAIAVLAANVLGMKFCSVDVIQLADDSLQVLEVNAGVMMDSFLSSSDEYRNIARKIYTDVILDGLNS
jgi:glutathione synthase/RimK-type ligase-like ATP-grasp enzyme